LEQRIAAEISQVKFFGQLYRQEIDEVLTEAGSPPISQLGTPLCLDVEFGREIVALGGQYPDMVAAEPIIYDDPYFELRNEEIVTAVLNEIGKGVTIIRKYAGPAIKSLPPEKKFGLVTWLEIFPSSFSNQEYFLSVAAMAMQHLTEGGALIASAAENNSETKNIFAEIARLIPEKVPAATAKFIETTPRGNGCIFIVARKNSGGN
jgi:hypothetical protein